MKKHEIKTLPIDKLYTNTYNSNKMPEIKFQALVDTIRRNGQTSPIQVVEAENGLYRIVGGEHRYKAMKILKFKEVDVIVRAFDDEIDEQLGSIEDNLRGNPIAIKEAVIIAGATKKYRMGDLEKRLGQTEPEIKDKLFLLGEEDKMKKLQESIEREHTVEMDFIVDADAQETADRFVRDIVSAAKRLGATEVHTKVKLSKTKEAVGMITFNVSDAQKNIIDNAINTIMKSEDVTKSRALEFMAVNIMNDPNYGYTKSVENSNTKKKKGGKMSTRKVEL